MKKIYIAVFLLVLLPTVVVAQVIYPNRGGTGNSTSPSLDRMLIGNGINYDLKKLTAGTNVTIATTSGAITISASLPGGGLQEADIDTESELETILTDVSNLFTNNDGTLADDDLSNNDTDDLSEGSTNLYYTTARVEALLAATTTLPNLTTLTAVTTVGTIGTGVWQGTAIGDAYLTKTGNWTGTLDGYEASALLDDTTLSQEQVEDYAGGMFTGTETLISVTYQDSTGDVDFVVDNDLANYDNTTSAFLTVVGPTNLAALDFGDFTCNGTSCSLDASYLTTVDISDNTNLTVGATGLSLTGDDIALTSGYIIPTTASTSAFSAFRNTPSSRITAGDGLSWSTNTLNVTSLDISDSTNLAVTSPIVLTDDTVSINQSLLSITESQISDFGTYLTSNQSITLSGDVTGSGATSITTALSTDSVADNEIDYTAVTLSDFTFDVGSVDTTEFSYLNGVTSAIQTQLNAKEPTITADSLTYADISDSDQSTGSCAYIEDPTADDDLQSLWRNGTPNDILLTALWAESDQTVNLDLQVDDGTPADVNGTDISPAAGQAEDTSLSGDTTLAAGEELDLVITSVSGTPTWLSVCWTGNYVD